MEKFDSKNISKEEIEKMATILPKRLDKLEWNDSLNKISFSSVNEFEKASEKLDNCTVNAYRQSITKETLISAKKKDNNFLFA